MDAFPINVALFVYVISACGLLIYAMNCYVMIFLFLRNRKAATERLKKIEKQGDSPALQKELALALLTELKLKEAITKAREIEMKQKQLMNHQQLPEEERRPKII